MPRSAPKLREDALAIWRAGVAAVAPARLIGEQICVDGRYLWVADEAIELYRFKKIYVVGAGKAAAGMTTAFENVLGAKLLVEKDVRGWVNVPADCVVDTQRVHLHAGRPPGVNEPRPEALQGTDEILKTIQSAAPDDLCVCLLSGGGSALLVSPVPGVTLDDKVAITRLLSGAGANIDQLNIVRRAISRVKGGGLAQACNAGMLLTLIISDVLGDSLETIASGPTILSTTTPRDALRVLEEFKLIDHPAAASIVHYLQRTVGRPPTGTAGNRAGVKNVILGNNATAVDAAGIEAEARGYSHAMVSATAPEGSAEKVGEHLARMADQMRRSPGPDCLITGGEPVVELADPAVRGKGGRNQQLVLAALCALDDCRDVALVSGGTDGEDGPTDAAGAFVDEQIALNARALRLDFRDHLRRNDAYPFFDSVGGLLKTGPTNTNVCDLRVVTVSRQG